jgi:hypothetical protein
MILSRAPEKLRPTEVQLNGAPDLVLRVNPERAVISTVISNAVTVCSVSGCNIRLQPVDDSAHSS